MLNAILILVALNSEQATHAELEGPGIHGRQALPIESTIEVFIGADVKVRLPGTDRELIKFVWHGLQFEAITNGRPSAFERIDFGKDWAAERCCIAPPFSAPLHLFRQKSYHEIWQFETFAFLPFLLN
ncbi:hypothetical protein Q31a_47450 [Aureliella helgolandensis]|uniref:Uncharacterized protein n=1 Tax=Aureliella helgolandensis TaxID=2527968 RepID=A0A518GCP8_9BACT|nr:hypothetical protein Q31a_47450 [Aureliella helgolandensis]